MEHVLGLECVICGEMYGADEVQYVCPNHGNDGILDVKYDYELIAHRVEENPIPPVGSGGGIWRYRDLLPVAIDEFPPLMVGDTPLYNSTRLANALGIRKVLIKDDSRQPSASFKDRASALALVKAEETGAGVIATASTGNAAAALACIAASVEKPTVIFVPASAPKAKIAQLLVYGSTVMLVEASYDAAFELCLEACDKFGWYNRNTAFNPYMTEGKKTVVYEVCQQLGQTQGGTWQVPDVVVVPVGDGCIIGGVHKGFTDLLQLGWIDQMPRIIGVQAAGSDFLWQAWSQQEDVLTKAPIVAETVADSISAGLPRDRIKAMRAVNQTGGAFVRVSDEMILNAIPILARATGVFAEPAAAAAYAGLESALRQGFIEEKESVLVLVTGSGLKDINAAMRAKGDLFTIKPSIDEVVQVVSNLERGV